MSDSTKTSSVPNVCNFVPPWNDLNVSTIASVQFMGTFKGGPQLLGLLNMISSSNPVLGMAAGEATLYNVYVGSFTNIYGGVTTGSLLQDPATGQFFCLAGANLVASSTDPTQSAAVFSLAPANPSLSPLTIGGGENGCAFDLNDCLLANVAPPGDFQLRPNTPNGIVPGGNTWLGATSVRFDLLNDDTPATLRGISFEGGVTNCNFNSEAADGSGLNTSPMTLEGCTFDGSVADMPIANCDFTGSVLSNCTFKGTVSGCNFSNTTISGTSFAGVTFQNCTFAGATFSGVDFAGADLGGAGLDAVLHRADNPTVSNFSACTVPASWFGNDWSYLNLTGATITGVPATLSTLSAPVDFSHSTFDQVTAFAGTTIEGANFNGSSLKGVNLSGSSLSFSSFVQATLGGDASDDGATLTYATMFECDLSGAVLDYADCSFAIMWGAAFSLNGASVYNTNFSNAFMAEVDFSSIAAFPGSSFSGACLVNAKFQNVTFEYAAGSNVIMTGAALQGVDFTGSTLGYVTMTNAAIATEGGTLKIDSTYDPQSFTYLATVLQADQTTNDTLCDAGTQGPCTGTSLTTPQDPSKAPSTIWPADTALARQRQETVARLRAAVGG